MRVAATIVLASSMAAALPAAAQSISEVVRQEEARRATLKSAARVYTNADLKPDPRGVPIEVTAPAAPAEGYLSASTGEIVTAEEMIARSRRKIAAAEKPRGEQEWRQAAAALRAERDDLQQKIDALQQPGGRSAAMEARTDHLLARARKALADVEARWQVLADAAVFANVPARWLQP